MIPRVQLKSSNNQTQNSLQTPPAVQTEPSAHRVLLSPRQLWLAFRPATQTNDEGQTSSSSARALCSFACQRVYHIVTLHVNMLTTQPPFMLKCSPCRHPSCQRAHHTPTRHANVLTIQSPLMSTCSPYSHPSCQRAHHTVTLMSTCSPYSHPSCQRAHHTVTLRLSTQWFSPAVIQHQLRY